MKTIIAGGRDLVLSPTQIESIVSGSGFRVTELICGMATGVDTSGMAWAKEKGLPVTECHANWSAHGRAAGPIRNASMATQAEALIAVWDGRSPGTADMILAAHRQDLLVFVHLVTK